MYKDKILAVPTAMLQNPAQPTPLELAKDMVLLEVMHYDFLGQIKIGHIVIHRLVLANVRFFFKTAFALQFPIHSVIPVSEFGWSDDASCAANNSSGHNQRFLADGRMSKHGIGCAIDINPVQNPCFDIDGETLLLKRIIPPQGIYRPGTPGTLMKGHPLVTLMERRRWVHGRIWTYPVDPQHFQKVPKALASWVK